MKATLAMRAIAPLAETQRGLVTTSQAAGVGVPRLALSRLEARGDLERVTRGVYRIPGSDADSLTELRADWLALDPARTAAERATDLANAVVVSHRSAAAVHRIGNMYADTHQYTARTRKQSGREGVSISARRLADTDITIAEGMLVTTIERTIADLAVREANLSDVADALADAYRRHEVHLDALVPMLDAASARHGTRSGAELLERMLEYRGLDAASAVRALIDSPVAREFLAGLTAGQKFSIPAMAQFTMPASELRGFQEAVRALTSPMTAAWLNSMPSGGGMQRLAEEARTVQGRRQ